MSKGTLATFGTRYRAVMRYHDLRNRDICERTGMDRHALSHLLAGDKEPSLATLQALLKALPHIPNTYWLICGDDR